MGNRFKCIEKSSQSDMDTSVVRVTDPTDSIEIPSINSCLAIICKLSDGSVIAGHATHPFAAIEGGDPSSIAKKIKEKCSLNGLEISETICVGDSNYTAAADSIAKESLESVQRELGRCIFWEKTTNYEDVIISKDGKEWKIVRNKRDK